MTGYFQKQLPEKSGCVADFNLLMSATSMTLCGVMVRLGESTTNIHKHMSHSSPEN